MSLFLARGLMLLPQSVWRRLPGAVTSWAVDQWMWAAVPALHSRYPSRSAWRRAVDALDPGGV